VGVRGVAQRTTGGGGSAPVYGNAVSVASLAAGSYNNYSPPGYLAGTTNYLSITPTGNVTLTGLVAPAYAWSIYVYNAAALTYTITLSNLSASSAAGNQFACPQAQPLALPPQTGAVLLCPAGGPWSFA
jgi:hypothetical protein